MINEFLLLIFGANNAHQVHLNILIFLLDFVGSKYKLYIILKFDKVYIYSNCTNLFDFEGDAAGTPCRPKGILDNVGTSDRSENS